jgi:hypothetical protein
MPIKRQLIGADRKPLYDNSNNNKVDRKNDYDTNIRTGLSRAQEGHIAIATRVNRTVQNAQGISNPFYKVSRPRSISAWTTFTTLLRGTSGSMIEKIW